MFTPLAVVLGRVPPDVSRHGRRGSYIRRHCVFAAPSTLGVLHESPRRRRPRTHRSGSRAVPERGTGDANGAAAARTHDPWLTRGATQAGSAAASAVVSAGAWRTR